MGLKSFFHTIKMGFVRRRGDGLAFVPSEKRYGDNGEKEFVHALRRKLPDCSIKKNVVIMTDSGNAEIDCLVLYQDKLFAIEIKNWKGKITETDQGFVQKKTDYYTNEDHIKVLKSPFKQLNRAIYLLKKQISGNVWVNGIVFFADEEVDEIETLSDNVWFVDIDKLINHILTCGKVSQQSAVSKFFENCIESDCLFSYTWNKSLHCIIADESLVFQTENGQIGRKQIKNISVRHHWSYDELTITLKDNAFVQIVQENGALKTFDNGEEKHYNFSKLDYIELGSR